MRCSNVTEELPGRPIDESLRLPVVLYPLLFTTLSNNGLREWFSGINGHEAGAIRPYCLARRWYLLDLDGAAVELRTVAITTIQP